MTNLLPPGVKPLSSLGRRIEENLKNNFGKFEFDKFPSQHFCVVYFRTRLHVDIIQNEQISRDLQHRLSEQCLFEQARYNEHRDWQSC